MPIWSPPGALELPRGHPLLFFPEEMWSSDSNIFHQQVDMYMATSEVTAIQNLSASKQVRLRTQATGGQQAEPPSISQAALGATCGGAAGMISRAIIHPLDTLRVLQSVSSKVHSSEVVAHADSSAIERLKAATGHWLHTASRAVSDGRCSHIPHTHPKFL